MPATGIKKPQLDMKRSKKGQTLSWQQRISEETHKPLSPKEYISEDAIGSWFKLVSVEGDGTKAGGHNTQELHDKNMFMNEGQLFRFSLIEEQGKAFDGEE